METSKFDIADYLDSNEMITEYLNTVLAEGDDSDVITADKLIDKAEDFIDESADKIYKIEPYKKAGKSMEKTTLSLFRKAGKYWGKL